MDSNKKKSLTREQWLDIIRKEEEEILKQNYPDLGNEVDYQEWSEIVDYQEGQKQQQYIENFIFKFFGKHKKVKLTDGLDEPVIKYSTDQEKLEIIKNNDTIVDKTITGGGKTHFFGEYTTEILLNNNLNKVWYLDVNHTNPTNEGIADNYVNMMPRHKGMIYDQYGRLIHTQNNQPPDVPPNCINPDLFNKLYSKGHNINIPTPDNQDNTFPNPICAICPQRYDCRSGRGNGNVNFLFMRKGAIRANFTRANFSQLDPDYNYSNDLIILDEADREIDNLTVDIEAGNYELSVLYRHLPSYFNYPGKYHLKGFFDDLYFYFFSPLLDKKIKTGKYGLDHNELNNLLADFAWKTFLKYYCKLDNITLFKFLQWFDDKQQTRLLTYLIDTAIRWLKTTLLTAVKHRVNEILVGRKKIRSQESGGRLQKSGKYYLRCSIFSKYEFSNLLTSSNCFISFVVSLYLRS